MVTVRQYIYKSNGSFHLSMPLKEKQVEITRHIYQLRQRAKALQEEGKCLLEEAKQEVERMILGGE